VNRLEEKAAGTADWRAYQGIWVVMEMHAETGAPKKVSFELLSEARKLADRLGQSVTAVCLCTAERKEVREDLLNVGCDELLLFEHGLLGEYDTDVYTAVLSGLILQRKPAAVLFPGTENGRDLAPRVSARVRTGLTADCTALDIDDEGRLVQVRPTYGGNVIASIITPESRPQMASVRPNVFQVVHARKPGARLEVTCFSHGLNKSMFRVKHGGITKKTQAWLDVAEADILLVGGYGLGRENFNLLRRLAAKLGGAVGATRKAVDEGWAPFEIQIGQTGKTVAPRLYLACGVSGALQHTIGFKNAGKIIAINNDPFAPIFKISDVAILGDAGQVLPRLMEMVDQKGGAIFSAVGS
jgi:electron transfer flavoprotein alpha subunit